jgi:hypothetical protein
MAITELFSGPKLPTSAVPQKSALRSVHTKSTPFPMFAVAPRSDVEKTSGVVTVAWLRLKRTA